MRTPLWDVHVAAGATMTEFAGWDMPVRYGSELAEHHAVRTAAGVFDLSHMGELELTGSDAAASLDAACVSRLSAIEVGRAKYTMLCDAAGGVLDDVIVYRQADERWLLVANAANTAVVHAALTDTLVGDTTLADRSPDFALLAVQGPDTNRLVAPLTDADLAALRAFRGTAAQVAGHDVWLARTGYTGEDGVEIYAPAAAAADLWHAVVAVGATPAGLACRDTLRLEAGMPLYGHELSRQRTPQAAGMGRIVDLDHAFVGRDALAAAGPPTEVLVGLVADGRRAPRAGNAVITPGATRIGEVTSGALSPTLGHPIAMAYVAADHADTGTRLQVDVRGTAATVDVVDLPFYRRAKRS
ncbi:MAG: glycine cleavage system aminomethyltransferase GcvT [Nitriliruptoraceae bacterium]